MTMLPKNGAKSMSPVMRTPIVRTPLKIAMRGISIISCTRENQLELKA